jgi:glucosamine--fructose-6-phosphate aminotransferase (isomerizing)
MASGAATIVGPGTVVIALAPAGPGREATLDVARHAAGWGARVVEVGPGDRPAIEGADHLPLPASAVEDLAPLTAVAPVALLAFALARRRGHDPDHPAWVERYHSQGLRHIVGVGNAATEG